MEMPKPGEAHKKLEKLVGNWSGEERMAPSPWDPQGGTAVGRVTNRVGVDGFVVIQDYEQEQAGKVSLRGHGVFSWDDGRQKYSMIWYDSMGQAPNEFVGDFENDVLTLTNQSSQGHTRAQFDVSMPGRYVFRMDVSQDGTQWQNFMEGRYTK